VASLAYEPSSHQEREADDIGRAVMRGAKAHPECVITWSTEGRRAGSASHIRRRRSWSLGGTSVAISSNDGRSPFTTCGAERMSGRL
jgi:hypothetical protein